MRSSARACTTPASSWARRSAGQCWAVIGCWSQYWALIGQVRISMEQLRRLDTIKQGQFTATITEDEEPMPPKFLTDIQDAEVS